MRRVVTGVVGGRSVFLSDGKPANMHSYIGWPGHKTALIWSTEATPHLPLRSGDEPASGDRVTPAVGETRLLRVTFPPDSIFADPSFDPERYGDEAGQHLPGLIEAFEPNGSGMHRTASIDYGIVLDGEVWLELDDGAEVQLHQGDIIVQGGTRHAWRNKSDREVTLVFVLVGANASDCEASLAGMKAAG